MNTPRKALGIALLSALGLGTGSAFADNGVGGDETITDRVVNSSANWTVLVSEDINPANLTSCIATGSADAVNPNNGNDRLYRFTLSVDDPNPAIDGPFERTVDFDANRNKYEEVSSTATFRLLPPGMHTIYWLARKFPNTPNMTVADNSMTFVCANNLFDLDGPGDGNDNGD